MNEDFLRMMSYLASGGVPGAGGRGIPAEMAKAAGKFLEELPGRVERGEFEITHLESPSGSRALQGKSKDVLFTVMQANVEGEGIIHRGMAITGKATPNVIVLPPAVADKVYHQAIARRN